jgi:hypothetical protein
MSIRKRIWTNEKGEIRGLLWVWTLPNRNQ